MPIQLRCSCGQLFAVADRYAGTRLRCPKCTAVNKVPLENPEPRLEESLAAAPLLTSAAPKFDTGSLAGIPALPSSVQTGTPPPGASLGPGDGNGHGPTRDPLQLDAPAMGTTLRGSPFR